MSQHIGRRGALAVLAALTLAACLGLLAWGPVPMAATAHRYADARAWLSIPNAMNVLVNLPLFWAAVWGWCATRSSGWPQWLRVPWQWFHLFAMASALTAAMYHAAPSDTLFVLSHVGRSGAFIMLAIGVMAERIDARFGSSGLCFIAAVVVATLGATLLNGGPARGALDLRPLVLLEVVPILLVLVGVLSAAGTHTRETTWAVMLALYAFAKLLEFGDATIFRATGFISGHSLMHLNLAIAVAWMAYCAGLAAAHNGEGGRTSASSQRQTSLNTSA